MPKFNFNQTQHHLEFPAVMGILNLTPDSFSDGGRFVDPETACDHARSMVQDGAQIIDIGAESTRPGSLPVSEQEELSRILPVLEKLPKDEFILSLDTTKPAVAQAGLQAGVHIINDVSGGSIPLLDLASRYEAGFVAMHCQGDPQTMQENPNYEDVCREVLDFFKSRKEEFDKLHLPRLWIDPGIGFGKTLQNNLSLMRRLEEFIDSSWGILMGSSRKSWIDHLCDAPDPMERLGGSLASSVSAVSKGAEIIRAHDVQETVQALKVSKVLALKD